MSRHERHLCLPLIACVLLCMASSLSAAPVQIAYSRDAQTLSVEATGQPLLEVLGELAAQTGWQILVEPGSNPSVQTRFKEEAVGRGIELLVGRMNYALVPQRNGPTRLLVFRTSRDQATLRVDAADGDRPVTATLRRVGNELILTVEPGTDVEALAKRLGAKVTGHLEGTDIYRLEFEDEPAAELAREQLANDPSVKGVDSNYVVDRPSPPRSIPHGLLPPVQLSPNSGSKDGRIVIGLVDTAVQKLGGDLDDFLLPSKSVIGEGVVPADQLTHGTSMVETILRSIQQTSGGSTSIQILPVDVFGPNPTTTSFDVAMGILSAVNGGANLINASLGSYGGTGYLEEVVRQAYQKGIVVFAPVGNEPVTDPVYPAAYPDVIAVTATEGNQLAPYANRGSFVDMGAPGSSVVYLNGQAFVVNGTSVATAYASGLAAALSESQGLSLSEAAAALSQKFAVTPPSHP